MIFDLTLTKLALVLESSALTKINQERCVRIFYDVVKVVYYKPEGLNKPQLRMKKIAPRLPEPNSTFVYESI
jgi:hypothetical protein